VVELTRSTALVGHDSWADGRLGDYDGSDIMMNDYFLIEDFAPLDKNRRRHLLNRLGDAAAVHLREVLPPALAHYEQVYVLTHVPPYKEGCVYQGQPTRDDFLPHFGCKAVGDVLTELMARHPQKRLTVLCGHTHQPVKAQIRDNLVCWTGSAEYSKPRIEALLQVD
jgi:hypothetical protein